jgi:hypothetical protein
MIKRAESINCDLQPERCNAIIDDIFADLHEDVRSNILGSYISYHRRKQPKLNEATLISKAMAEFEPAWADRKRRFELVGGKEFLSVLSNRLHSEIGRAITLAQIVQEMRVSEVPADLVGVIESIETFLSEDDASFKTSS